MDTAQQLATPQERIPAEIWLEILELVPERADIHSLSLACRKFYDLSVRSLHRDIVWSKPAHAAQSLPIWDAYPGMAAAVRSLDLGVSSVLPGMSVKLIGVDGRPEPPPSRSPRLLGDGVLLHESLQFYDLYRESRGGFASPALHGAMFARIQTFKNITKLAFTDMILTNTHLALVHSLPQLRTLRLDLCLFNEGRGGPPPTYDHADLPITDLTIVNLRRRISMGFANQVQVQFDEHLAPVLTLCLARRLRTLTVDSSADVFRLIYNAWDAAARGWLIPTGLAHVFVVRRRVVDGEAQPMFAGENNFPESHLYHFAIQAQNLRTLSTHLFVPQNVAIAPQALPFGLERFAAPVETATLVASARKIEALGVLKCALGGREAINALENVSVSRPGLKMLMLELRGWDAEVMSAVAKLFKQLRRLKIVYEGSEKPSEDFLVALGPEFLSKMPHLHTLELYPQAGQAMAKPEHPPYLYDDSFESIDEEIANLVIPYNRYCPTLRRVQFCPGYFVSRACDGGHWRVERVRRLEEKDDLSY